MSSVARTVVVLVSILAFFTVKLNSAFANGGPFVVKYPNGDPAAKGVLARLDMDLKPQRETRLRVVKEDLKVMFGKDRFPAKDAARLPLAHVLAEYTIENPTSQEIEVDFGFPILRGIYIDPLAMMARPDVRVNLGEKSLRCTIISNSAIYGIIRQRAREVIEKGVSESLELKELVQAVGETGGQEHAVRKALSSHLVNVMKWNGRDAALMVEYASLDLGMLKTQPPDRSGMHWLVWDRQLSDVMNANLGPLAAIGEQKATQFFAQLASCFDPSATAAYETIFTAWGGDVREKSVDLRTGKVRPREITVDQEPLSVPSHVRGVSDPTIYARVDYLDPKAKISESEKTSCRTILKNLPVIFTFAPMNILYYQAKFPAESTQTLTVSYSQYAYADTRSPSSYQLAYVLHPASLWNEFGPINLEVGVPQGVGFQASVECNSPKVEQRALTPQGPDRATFNVYRTVLQHKTGELLLAVNADEWKRTLTRLTLSKSSNQVQRVAQQAR